MKKFYLMTLAAAMSLSMSAATLGTVSKTLQTGKPSKNTVEAAGTVKATGKSMDAKKKVRNARKADSSTTIEGLWTFQLGDYYFESSAGPFLADFEATLIDGTYVAFEDPNGQELPFGASFNSTTGVLTFEREYLGSTGTYYIYQEPYVFDYDVMDLIPQNITAAFIADEGVIEFQPDNGISWVAYSNEAGTNALGYFAIYDLEGAEKQVEWNSVGTGSFLENIAYGLFVGENTHYASVEITQNPTNPNLYKILNPFQDLYAALNIDAVSPAMVIDVTNPANVLIELQSTGISASSGGQSLGTLYYFNEGWYSEEYGDPLDPTLACTMTTDSEGNVTIVLPYHSCTIYSPATSQFFYGSAYESVLKFKLPTDEPVNPGTYQYGIGFFGDGMAYLMDAQEDGTFTGDYPSMFLEGGVVVVKAQNNQIVSILGRDGNETMDFGTPCTLVETDDVDAIIPFNGFEIVAAPVFVLDPVSMTVTLEDGAAFSNGGSAALPEALYLIGDNVNGDMVLLPEDDAALTYEGDGIYSWEGTSLGSSFRIIDAQGSALYYIGSAGAELFLGIPYDYVAGYASRDITISDITTVENPRIMLNTNTWQITIDSKTSKVEELNVEKSNTKYFDLNGIRVQNPTEGNIYIRVVDGTASKVMK